jgi:ABC-type multidrug transport system ATPase subunit
VVFDEPLVGLDPHGIRELKATIASLREQGCAVLVSTHMIDSVEQSWDVTYIMRQGSIARVCRREELTNETSLEQTYFSVIEPEGQETASRRTAGGTDDQTTSDQTAGDQPTSDLTAASRTAGDQAASRTAGDQAAGDHP